MFALQLHAVAVDGLHKELRDHLVHLLLEVRSDPLTDWQCDHVHVLGQSLHQHRAQVVQHVDRAEQRLPLRVPLLVFWVQSVGFSQESWLVFAMISASCVEAYVDLRISDVERVSFLRSRTTEIHLAFELKLVLLKLLKLLFDPFTKAFHPTVKVANKHWVSVHQFQRKEVPVVAAHRHLLWLEQFLQELKTQRLAARHEVGQLVQHALLLQFDQSFGLLNCFENGVET